jgi:hypothetical protein
VVDDAGLGVGGVQGDHVELGGDLGAQPGRDLVPAGRGDEPAGERLADLDARLGPGGAAELDDAPDQGHLLREAGIEEIGDGRRARVRGAPSPVRPDRWRRRWPATPGR